MSSEPALAAARPAPTVVIVGAGPAAIMLLERVLARHRTANVPTGFEVVLIDPYEPGGGRIWRRDQSPLVTVNSMARDVAVFPDGTSSISGPIEPGPSLAEWVRAVRAGEIDASAVLDSGTAAEVESLADTDFPSRRLNGAYLAWVFREVQRRAGSTATVRWIRDTVTSVNRTRSDHDPASAGERHRVELEGGTTVEADVVVYALGQSATSIDDDSRRLRDAAAAAGLHYRPPAFTADDDYSEIRPGEPAIIRGMGLAAIDTILLLTQGRGGVIEHDVSGKLTYRASGREPQLLIGSGRGVPYRSKVTSALAGDPVALEYLDSASIAALLDEKDRIDFADDVWPRVQADLVTGYYRELFTAHPERVVGDWSAFAASLRAALTDRDQSRLTEVILASVPRPEDRFDLESFDRPLAVSDPDTSPERDVEPGGIAGRRADPSESDAAIHDRVVRHVERDVAERSDQATSSTQALFLTALAAYLAIAEVPPERWNIRSRIDAIPHHWQRFFSYVASGPPGNRLRELLALADAGIVRFIGAEVRVGIDEQDARFRATGTATTADGRLTSTATARVLVDAWLPELWVSTSTNPLVRQLIESGQAREAIVTDGSESRSTGRILVGADGSLPCQPGQFAIGPFTTLASAGAFTRPGSDSLSFRVHDRVAEALLNAVVRDAPRVPASSELDE